MDIREGEQILKIFHHHYTPFIFWIFRIIFVFLPFYLLLFFIQKSVSADIFIIVLFVIFLMFFSIVLYKSFVYWLDKLYVTNQRIIYVNWVSIFSRKESEALLDDIQDIKTNEKGIISYIKIFDYGTFSLTTASAKTTLTFDLAPDPEGIRQYIYHIRPQ